MIGHDDEFLARLRETFKVEADEHLTAIASGLVKLETSSGPAAATIIEQVFRAAHTLKGAARAVDLREVEGLCQSLEEVFASWRRGETAPSTSALDSVHHSLDLIGSALSSPARRSEVTPGPDRENDAGSDGASATSDGASATDESDLPPEPSDTTWSAADPPVIAQAATVRVPIASLESHLLQVEEVLGVKLATAQRAADLREIGTALEEWRAELASIQPELSQLFKEGSESVPAKRLLEFVESTAETAKAMEGRLLALRRKAESDRDDVAKLVNQLLDDATKLLLLPFRTISASFPKLVRDLSRDQGKEADLTIRGDEIRIDKRILEEIKNPIIHLLRNSVDHGVETPAKRVERGKPARASIEIGLSQTSPNEVLLIVSDDGAGIDADEVRRSAVNARLIPPEEASELSDAEARQLVFASSVTTSAQVTHLSGRGLGLAIVREKTESLGGVVSVESEVGAGTTFRMTIPARRATFRGIVVKTAGELVVIPTTQVERVTRANRADVKTVQGRETISCQERAIPLVPMALALGLPWHNETSAESEVAVVLGIGDDRVAFTVDSVVDEQEMLVKSFEPPLVRVRNIAAATVLGSGAVAPIVHVSDLVKSAKRVHPSARPEPRTATAAASILLVEDSITSRALLKSILESAGYAVQTAVDGLDALTRLKTEQFDLVVSDVEMPRLSGFDLTSRIRGDRSLAELPVILVTALETREDRERGIDVGANAYIVKGSFDQSDLLDAVRRLL